MSFVSVDPQSLFVAAGNLMTLGSDISSTRMNAAAATTGLPAAGSDEVSAAIANLFSMHAQNFQKLAAKAAMFHDRFTQTLASSANAYATAEAINVTSLASDVSADLTNALAYVVLAIVGLPIVIVLSPAILAFLVILASAAITHTPYL